MHKEVDLELPTYCDVTQYCLALFSVSHNRRHRIRIAKEQTYEVVFASCSLNQQEWMHSIESFSTPPVIVRAILASRIHSPRALHDTELSHSLTEAIESLRGQFKVHLNVLVHKN